MCITFTEDTISKVKLIDNSPYKEGRLEFWNDLCNILSDLPMSSLIFGKKIESVGGYFKDDRIKHRDGRNVRLMPVIVMPDNIAEYSEDYVKFNSDEQFAIFIHEVGHFMHLVNDSGKYKAPSLIDKKPAIASPDIGFAHINVADLEYEAGYRSLVNSKIYELYADDDRTILETNLTNMLNYMKIENKKELMEPFMKNGKLDENKKDEYKEVFNQKTSEWKKKINKWSEIADYKITL